MAINGTAGRKLEALKLAVRLEGMKDRADANRAGQDEQKVATLETTIEAQRKMNDANAAGPRTANDVDDKLRSGRF